MKFEVFEDKIDELKQYNRINCLVVHGTNIKTNKNNHGYVDAVISILNDKLHLSYDICPEDDIVHPLPPNKKRSNPNPNQIYSTFNLKRSLCKEMKLAKIGITITESLTKCRLDLLKYAQTKLRFRNCWTSKGNIYCSIMELNIA